MNIKVIFVRYDNSIRKEAYMTHIPRIGEHIDFDVRGVGPLHKVAAITHNIETGIVTVGLVDSDE
jgi:aminoglycoside/choline kinase family phosphotransferase